MTPQQANGSDTPASAPEPGTTVAPAAGGPTDNGTGEGLTPARRTLLEAVRDEWVGVALATGDSDRDAAEWGVRLAYQAAGLAPPERIIWLPSPYDGCLSAALVADPALREGSGALWEKDAVERLAAQGLDLAAGAPAGRLVSDQVRTRVWAEARTSLEQRVGSELMADAWTSLGPRMREQVTRDVFTPVREAVATVATDLLPPPAAARTQAQSLRAVYGQHDAPWLALFDFLGRILPDPSPVDRLGGLQRVARNAGWWWPFDQVAILTDRPNVVSRDGQGRLHWADGPAVTYPGGLALYRWHGMPVSPELVEQLPKLTVRHIQDEPNAELRRVMMEYYGHERFMRDAGASKVHTDATGVLWRLPVEDDEPLVMVEVVNATPEPDGSERRYWLRVPPGMRTAREAVAWTFGVEPRDYRPLEQS